MNTGLLSLKSNSFHLKTTEQDSNTLDFRSGLGQMDLCCDDTSPVLNLYLEMMRLDEIPKKGPETLRNYIVLSYSCCREAIMTRLLLTKIISLRTTF
jgi:hypothetical protein